MNKKDIRGIFKDWVIDGYQAKSPDRKYILWISNGFVHFEDDKFFTKERFLSGFNLIEKYIFWRELKREIKQRILEK